MNETPPPPPFVPPFIPRPVNPGDHPADREPISNLAAAMECILRQPLRVIYHFSQPGCATLIGRLLIIAVVLSLCYGLVVGTFSGGDQLWAAPLKITVGLFLSTLICLPSLYIFACLAGSRATLGEICGFVSGLLTLMTLLLIGFAPVAWVFSQSTESIALMGALHLIFALIAVYFGVRFLNLGFTRGSGASPGALSLWTIVYILVLLQMTTALRPIIGTAPTFLPTQKQFFLSHWGDNLEK